MDLPDWAPLAVLGLAFGLVVSAFEHFLLLRGLKKGEGKEPRKAKNILLSRFASSSLITIAALYLVHRNTAILIGTAIGLIFSKHILIIRYLSGNSNRKE